MQFFLPDPDLNESAYALDTERLGEQLDLAYQAMQSLKGFSVATSEVRFNGLRTIHLDPDGQAVPEEDLEKGVQYSIFEEPEVRRVPLDSKDWSLDPWTGFTDLEVPSLSLWKGYEWHLLLWHRALSTEWTENAGRVDTTFPRALWLYFRTYKGENDSQKPPWLGDMDIHRSHQSELIRHDAKYYQKQFPDTPDDIPYEIWPKQTGF